MGAWRVRTGRASGAQFGFYLPRPGTDPLLEQPCMAVRVWTRVPLLESCSMREVLLLLYSSGVRSGRCSKLHVLTPPARAFPRLG